MDILSYFIRKVKYWFVIIGGSWWEIGKVGFKKVGFKKSWWKMSSAPSLRVLYLEKIPKQPPRWVEY